MTNWGGYYPPGVSDRDFVDRGPWLCERCEGLVYNEDHIDERGYCRDCQEKMEEEMITFVKDFGDRVVSVTAEYDPQKQAYVVQDATIVFFGHITDRYGLEAGPRHVRR